jgi:uncharacterized membrane protein
MYKVDRLTAFSDGVIAIAITLLVLGLEVPSVHEVPEQQLTTYLVESMRPFLGYISSFVLVGTYWLQHYAIFHYIERADRPLIALNGLFLLSISFVPFPTGLQSAYRHDELAMILYAGTHIVCGSSLLLIWIYASAGHRLINRRTSSSVIRSMSRRIAFTPILSLCAIPVSFLNIDLSRILFLAIPIAYLSHRVIDQDQIRSQGEDDGTET